MRRLPRPLVFGFLGAIVAFAGSWIPSFWGDEAASVLSAQRPLPSLFAMLTNVDAVHGTYYTFLHFWIGIFGSSELAVRLPSALAAGAAVAGTWIIANRVAGARVAFFAAIVCVVLPRITYMGSEGRAYAISTAFAVWLTALRLVLLEEENTSRRAWIAYSILLTVGIYFFLYVALVPVAHGIYIAITRRDRLRRWLCATALAAVAASPIIVLGYLERQQVEFLIRRPPTVDGVLVGQWFDNPVLAVACWALIAVACVLAWRRRESRAVVALALPWLAVPTVVLLLMTVTVVPTYTLRYVSMSAPAVAILVGVGIACIPRPALRGAALILVIALAVPSIAVQRTDFAKGEGSDWRQASEYIASEAHPGDAVVFDESSRPSRRPRLALRLYPDSFAGLVDVGLKTPFGNTTGIWDVSVPISDDPSRVAGFGTVWLLETTGSHDNRTATTLRELIRLGFVETSHTLIHRTEIHEMTRSTP